MADRPPIIVLLGYRARIARRGMPIRIPPPTRVVISSAVLIVGLASIAAWQVAALRPRGPSFAGLPRIVLIAHRGGAGEARENSISGAERMLASGSVDVLDADTRQLADGTLVLMHDARLERTTDHDGAVSAYTAATWRGVVLDSGIGQPEPAPTLAGYLDAVGGRAVITVEAKDAAAVPRLVAMIRGRQLQESVLINTNDPAVARTIHAAGMITHLWRSADQLATDDPRQWAAYVHVLDVDYRASDAQIRAAVHSGIPRIWAHTLTTAAERDRMLRLGLTGVVTDYPLSLDER